jgi:ketosteroid isomerase-like protein
VKRHPLNGIDLQTFLGLLSDTLMSGARASHFVPVLMNRRLAIGRTVSIVLLLALSGSIIHALQVKPRKHEARHEIDQLEEVWRNAVLKSDTTAMSALLADDYIAITASGTLQTKNETLANVRNHRVHFTALNISDRKVRFYGKTALVTSLAEVKATTPDGDISGSYRYTRVYVRDAQGQWKIVSFETNRIRRPGAHR